MTLRPVPLTLAQANSLVEKWHRHHSPVLNHRFSIGVITLEDSVLHGAAIIGRPVGGGPLQYLTAEVTRLVTDGTPNACSLLYAAAARAAKAMGYFRIQTFILDQEPGTSLKAAGWRYERPSNRSGWHHPAPRGARQVPEHLASQKQLWALDFTEKKKKSAEEEAAA